MSAPVNSQLLDILLKNRSIHTPQEREIFLNPSYDTHMHDPMLLPNMEKAVSRILSAIQKKEKIIIYSDYDADGIPGGVILHDFFKKIGYEHFSNYIPHRHDEGFGLHIDAIDSFIKDGVQLIITIDCGITDAEEVTHANNASIDVIITDHHIPHGRLPDAHAIVDAKLSDNIYPFPELCGSAVIFKVVQALVLKGNFGLKSGFDKWLLDMVGLATLSDMVPLVGENRILAYYGLKVLRKSPRPGLMKLFSKMNVKSRDLTEDDVTFMIAPRINAASRMGHPIDAFNMLSEQKEDLAIAHAEYLISLNDERKRVTASINTSIRKAWVGKDMRPVIVIGNANWKPGVLGLVANSLAEEHQRPVFVWGREESVLIKGSVRTGDTTNIVELMEKTKDMFVDFGGHAASGGFSISLEKIDLLDDALNAAYATLEPVSKKSKEKMIDAELTVADLTKDTLMTIEHLAPFGMGNPKPLFLIKGITPISIRSFGKGNVHMEVSIVGPEGPIQAIVFFKTLEHFPGLTLDKSLSILGHLERSYWRGRSALRVRIVDVY